MDGILIPSLETARAVDYVFPAENRFRGIVARVACGEKISDAISGTISDASDCIRKECLYDSIACAIVERNPTVRQLIATAKVETLAEAYRGDLYRFATQPGFRRIVARAMCGASDDRYAADLANMVIAFALSSKMIAADIKAKLKQ